MKQGRADRLAGRGVPELGRVRSSVIVNPHRGEKPRSVRAELDRVHLVRVLDHPLERGEAEAPVGELGPDGQAELARAGRGELEATGYPEEAATDLSLLAILDPELQGPSCRLDRGPAVFASRLLLVALGLGAVPLGPLPEDDARGERDGNGQSEGSPERGDRRPAAA